MPEVNVDFSQLSDAVKATMSLPGVFTSARRSAIKSVGWMVQQNLRNHIEYGGTNWPKLHPLTQTFKHKYGARGRWTKRRGSSTALFWLGKFARYRTLDKGDTVRVDFGKSKKGQAGTIDYGLMSVVARAEEGDVIAVTPKMRRFLGATRRQRPKVQVPGQTFFPLRSDTTRIRIPPRPIFTPVWNKVAPDIPKWFETRFLGALDRRLSGVYGEGKT